MAFTWITSGWSKVRNLLHKTRTSLTSRIKALFGSKIDATRIEELEEILFEADLGVPIIQDLISKVQELLKKDPSTETDTIIRTLEESLSQEITPLDFSLHSNENGPTVFLIIGANGSGKTTSIAKLAHGFAQQGKSVLLAAADTFRAAAQEQLASWAKKLNIEIIRANYQADPASVAFDAIQAAKSRNIDILLIDTAGRLENKNNLLRELEKVTKSCHKALEGAPHEALLVLDATIGQNGIEQAVAFNNASPITGLILTKLDGSAKGGSVMAIQKQLSKPVKFIGTGESMEDLAPFDPKGFVHSMFYETGGE